VVVLAYLATACFALGSARIGWEGKRYNVKAPFFHPRPDGAEVTGWIASPLCGEAPELFDGIHAPTALG
jgi:hypothetical protein